MHRLFAVAVFAALSVSPALAQGALWTDVSEAAFRPASPRVTVPDTYRVVRLDEPQLRQRLATTPEEARLGSTEGGVVLPIPLPDGREVQVRVVESSVMAPALQARYPEIRTYLASGPGMSGRLSLTPRGFHGLLFTPEGAVYVDPYSPGDTQHYLVYHSRDLAVDSALRGREADEVREIVRRSSGDVQNRSPGSVLRTYRLAVAATGEYTQFHGGTVSAAMAAIVTTINRVTGIYERDVAVRFQLIANNDLVVYTNGATDPYSNNSGGTMLGQNISNLNAVIGSANFDVGHVFSTGGGGVAYLGVICSSSKAGGVTGSSAPVGDAFDVDYVAHEMGHQFGANHTFNGNAGSCGGGNRNASTAYEPGSGATIMAYAGICGSQDLQSNSDPYFHAVSLDEINAHISGSGGTCAATISTGNPIPTVSAAGGYTIPAGTPFTLTGSATDDTPGTLTFAWEEFDLGSAGAPGGSTPPYFRSFNPTPSPSRTFPQMSRLLAGQAPVIGEALPSGTRTLNFRLTARDNHPGGGATNNETISIGVDGSAGPFTVTFASTSGQTHSGSVNVTWNVAGTNGGSVNTPTVDILFSDDNGATWAYTLASGTPNDGAQAVTLPNVSTSQGRILIRGVGNVFFNVNGAPFTVTPGGPPPSASVSPSAVSASVEPEGTGSSTVLVSNTAGSGAAPLVYSAGIQNATAARPELAGPLSAAARPVVATTRAPKGLDLIPEAGVLARGAGGPDAFGYEWTDSDEPGGPAVSFQDISGTGTPVAWTAASTYPAGDEGYADIALPFTFPFYGAGRTSVRVFTNGFLTFTSLTGDTFTNGTIPSASTPNAVIAPFWDDLDPSSGGTVYTGTFPDGRFVVQYSGVLRYGTSAAETFQVILEPSGAIEFQYGTMSGTLTSATVGIEDDAGAIGLQVVQNGIYVTSNKAVRFAIPLTWITVSPTSGTVQPGNSDALTLDFDATGLAEGTYTADLVVTTNDPSNTTVTVPVTLNVETGGTGSGPIAFTAPTAGATLTAGTTYTVTWSPGSVPGSVEMKLVLKSPTQGDATIERGVPNTGSYAWAIPATQPEATDYRIIGVYTDPATGRTVRPTTDDFSISGGVPLPEPITVTSPTSGTVWTAGTTQAITWDPGDVPASVKLQIRVLSNTNVRIAKNVLNDGSWDWDIPSGQAPGTNYRIMLVYTDPATGAKVKPKSDTFEISTSSARTAKGADVLALLPVVPNPTRGQAEVAYLLPEAGEVRLSVHDVRGREVAVLADGTREAGAHTATWTAGGLAPGVYVVRLQAGVEVLTQRAVVVR